MLSHETGMAVQRVIIDLLDTCSELPEDVVADHLRRRLKRQGLPVPPEPWLRTVAGEVVAKRIYIVATGSLPPGYKKEITTPSED